MAQRVTYGQSEGSNLGLTDEIVQQGGNNLGVDPTYGPINGPELNFQDVLSSPSLEAAKSKKSVSILAKGLASLDAGPFVSVAQTLSGSQNSEKLNWDDVAMHAKGLGAPIVITDPTGSPVAMFSDKGNAYLWAESQSGNAKWFQLDFGETQQFVAIPIEDQNGYRGGGLMQILLGEKGVIQGIAGAAKKQVPGHKDFFTSELPYTLSPKVEIGEDRSWRFIPGQNLIGVTAALPGTLYSLVVIQKQIS
jgi:hypothetical protein